MTTTPPSSRRSSRRATALEQEAWPKLTDAAIDRLRDVGEVRAVQIGDVMFEVGQDSYDLVYVESGAVSIVDRASEATVAVVDEGHFMGEIGMLMGQRTFFAGVVSEPGQVIVVPLAAVRELIATVPEIGDPVVAAYAARRQLLIEWGEGGLVIVGDEFDTETRRLREFVTRNQIPSRFVDRSNTAEMLELAAVCALPASGAAVVTGRSQVLTSPTPRDLAAAIGLDLIADVSETFDVLVVGAGPSGLAAAVYAASEGLSVVVVEDTAIGGQAGTSSRIENYLGFPQGVSGMELAYRGEIQAVKFGARIVAPRRATAMRRGPDGFDVTLDDGTSIAARTVVLANGVQYRRLPLDRLEEYEGRGVYYSATELEARFSRGTQVIVVGGGNSAGQAAMFLSRHAACTHIVVRGTGLAATMSSYLSNRIESDARIQLWTETEIVGLAGEDALQHVTLRNSRTGEEQTLDSSALFIMIGAGPNTAWLDGQVELDDHGFVLTGRDAGETTTGFETSAPGVYAVGDLRSGSVKRVASAVGEGSVVVSAVHRHIEGLRRAALPTDQPRAETIRAGHGS